MNHEELHLFRDESGRCSLATNLKSELPRASRCLDLALPEGEVKKYFRVPKSKTNSTLRVKFFNSTRLWRKHLDLLNVIFKGLFHT